MSRINIILLIIGITLVGSGISANAYMRYQVSEGVPIALQEIRDEMLPEIEDLVHQYAVADALYEIKEYIDADAPYILNGSTTAQTINGSLQNLAASVTMPVARNMFFNDPFWSINTGGLFPINSCSEVQTGGMGTLGFTVDAQNRLLDGYDALDLPGIISDLELGFDIYYYLEYYYAGLTDLPTQLYLMTGYNATWSQLSNITDYIVNYMFDDIVPAMLGAPASVLAPSLFYQQWANGTLLSSGIDCEWFIDIEAGSVGIEAGIPDPTNISMSSCIDLFDHENKKALTNLDDGVDEWIEADDDDDEKDDLMEEFGITEAQVDMILDWLWGDQFFDTLLPDLVIWYEDCTIEEYAEDTFYDQWANGDYDDEGIPLPMDDGTEVMGWEVGIPEETDMKISTAKDLFDDDSEYSLTNSEGIQKWYIAINEPEGNTAEKLQDEFNLDDDQMGALLSWLPKFRDEVVPELSKHQLNLAVDPYSLGFQLMVILGISGALIDALALIRQKVLFRADPLS